MATKVSKKSNEILKKKLFKALEKNVAAVLRDEGSPTLGTLNYDNDATKMKYFCNFCICKTKEKEKNY